MIMKLLYSHILTSHSGDVQGDILPQTLQFPGDSPAGLQSNPGKTHLII